MIMGHFKIDSFTLVKSNKNGRSIGNFQKPTEIYKPRKFDGVRCKSKETAR